MCSKREELGEAERECALRRCLCSVVGEKDAKWHVWTDGVDVCAREAGLVLEAVAGVDGGGEVYGSPQ